MSDTSLTDEQKSRIAIEEVEKLWSEYCQDCCEKSLDFPCSIKPYLDLFPHELHSELANRLYQITQHWQRERQARSSMTLPPEYELLGEIGKGGMGVVYKAREISLGRMVALKMARTDRMKDPEQFRKQLRSEAAIQGNIPSHPNVVQVYALVEHEGQLCIVMEYVEDAKTLEDLVKTPLEPRQAAERMHILALALAHVHKKKIVHRDLKPQQILITKDGVMKIADFGLAKRFDQTSETVLGTIKGTLEYMAPEQAGGDAKRIGPHTDVWALGAMLYELLTAKKAFGMRPDEPITAFLKRIETEEHQWPQQSVATIPGDLRAIVDKCLQKDIEERYQTSQALAHHLDLFLKGEPVPICPRSRAERVWRWCRRHRALTASSVMGFLLIFTVLIAAYHYAARKTTESKAITDIETAITDKETAISDKEKAEAREKVLRQYKCDQLLALAVSHLKKNEVKHALENALAALNHAREANDAQRAQTCRAFLDNWSDWNPPSGQEQLREYRPRSKPSDRSWRGILVAVEAGRLDDSFKDSPTRMESPLHEQVHDLAVSHDGQYVVTAHADGVAQLWKPEQHLQRPFEVHAVVLPASGELLLVGRLPAPEAAWQLIGCKPHGHPLKHPVAVHGVAFTKKSDTLITGEADGLVRFWNVSTGKADRTLDAGQPITAVASLDDRTIVTITVDTVQRNTLLTWWNPKTGQDLKREGYDYDGFRLGQRFAPRIGPALAPIPNSRKVIVPPYLYDLNESRKLLPFGEVYSKRALEEWRNPRPDAPRDAQPERSKLEEPIIHWRGAAIDSDGERMWVYRGDTYRAYKCDELFQANLFNKQGIAQPVRAVCYWYGLSAVAISPGGKYVAIRTEDDYIQTWSVSTRLPHGNKCSPDLFRAPSVSGRYGLDSVDSHTTLAISPDGNRILTSTPSYMEMWDVASGQSVGTIAQPPRRRPTRWMDWSAVSFSEDGSRFVTVAFDEYSDTLPAPVRLRPPIDGEKVEGIPAPASTPTKPGGVPQIHVWDAARLLPLREFTLAHRQQRVDVVVFGRDGFSLVVADWGLQHFEILTLPQPHPRSEEESRQAIEIMIKRLLVD